MDKFNLELLAQIVGGQFGLKVNSGSGFAIWKEDDGRLVMTVPPMRAGTDQDVCILRSGIAHEAVGHARHTDFSAKRGPTELHKALENVLEDARIEKAAWKVYPKCRQMLDEGMQALLAKNGLRRAATEVDPGGKASIAILLRLLSEELGYCKGGLDWTVDWAQAVEAFDESTMSQAWDLSVQGYQKSSTQEVIEVAAQIVKILQKSFEGGQASQGDQGSESGKGDQGSQGSESGKGDQGQRKGRGRELNLNAIRSYDFDRGNLLEQEINQLTAQKNEILVLNAPLLKVANPHKPSKNGITAYQRLKTVLTQRLQTLVEDEDDSYTDTGSLSSDRLVDARLGMRDVFHVPGEPGEGVDTAISLLIDSSGSMSFHASDCLDATWAIANAINGYTPFGVNFSIASYNHNLQMLKPWKAPWLKGSCLHFYFTSGGTRTEQAVHNRLEDLAKRREKRRILFLITDGDIGNLEPSVNAAKAGNMELVVLVIAENKWQKQIKTPDYLGKNFSVVCPENLSREMLQAVIKMF